MKERPILFSGPMVRALIDGRKTQTRRVMKPNACGLEVDEITELPALDPILKCVVSGHSGVWEDGHGFDLRWNCPYGVPGDRLWVRETWQFDNAEYVALHKREPWHGGPSREAAEVHYRATERHPDIFPKWTPSIFMPMWASRLTLEITNVRVERVQDISEDDAKAEGVTLIQGNPRRHDGLDFSSEYASLWDSLNAKRGYGWKVNPWVWVVSFRRL